MEMSVKNTRHLPFDVVAEPYVTQRFPRQELQKFARHETVHVVERVRPRLTVARQGKAIAPAAPV